MGSEMSREEVAEEIGSARVRVAALRNVGLRPHQIAARVAAETNVCVYAVNRAVYAIYGSPGNETIVRLG